MNKNTRARYVLYKKIKYKKEYIVSLKYGINKQVISKLNVRTNFSCGSQDLIK